MRRKILLSIVAIVALSIIGLCFGGLALAGIVLLLLFFYYCNSKVFSTNYWNNRYLAVNDFLAAPFFRSDERRNFLVANLGSAPSHHAFNYGSFHGLNLSSGCQTLETDLEILRSYHSFIRKGGFVILGLSPYQIYFKEDVAYCSRFIRKVPGEPAKYRGYYANYSYLLPQKSRMVPMRFMRYPILYKPLEVICSLFADIPKGLPVESIGRRNWPKCCMAVRESLGAHDDEIVSLYIQFCKERDYCPVIVVLPVEKSLVNAKTEAFSNWVRETYGKRCKVMLSQEYKAWDASDFSRPLIMKESAAKDFTTYLLSNLLNESAND